MKEPDFESLRTYVRDKNDRAFDDLVRRHEGWLFAAARRRLHDDHLAEDATQTALFLLASKAESLIATDQRSVAAWLFHVMHFTCSGILRTRSRQHRNETAAGTLKVEGYAKACCENEGVLTALEDTIAQLPPRDREAVVRRFYQRESLGDIGTALGISADAARKRIARTLAACRVAMANDGLNVDPDELLDRDSSLNTDARRARTKQNGEEIRALAKGTMDMVEQVKAMEFALTTAEFYVRDVPANLDFFEKLGFRRWYTEAIDADGHVPRASLRGGHARIWLRRSDGSADTEPRPGVKIYFWLDGGEEAVTRHREAIAAQGVAVNQFFYDVAMLNFTVTSPDGYSIGFFSTYQPVVFDVDSKEPPPKKN